jgi:hypothetical protein
MASAAQRATLAGSGEHIAAVLMLGSDYTDEQYLEAIEAAREAGVGEAYADKILGTDVDAFVRGVDQDSGEAIVRAAESNLRRRGIDPRRASYREFADALVRVSP